MKSWQNAALIAITVFLGGLGVYKVYRFFYPRVIKADLIISNGTLITMNNQREVIPNGVVVIRGTTILAVGPAEITQYYSAQQTIDAHKGAILPGFINGHVHAAMTLFRGVSDDAALAIWLNQYIFPLEKKYASPDFVYWGTMLGILEMIQAGTTTAVDMYLHEASAAQAFHDLGMRAIAGYNIVTADDLAPAQAYISQWLHDQLVTPAVAPHSPYACTTEVLLAAQKLSETYHTPLLMHIAETQGEVDQITKQYGKSPVAYLASLGLLSNRLIGAHLVKVNDAEMDLLKTFGVGVIHNPVSNMKLASGIAPIAAMLKKKLLVGLGTDGAASNNSLSMLETIKLVALAQKTAMNDPQVLDAQTALELATIRGAQAIHQADSLGSLEPGKKADVIIISLKNIHQQPVYNVVSQIVYASEASDVDTVIINGNIRMLHRTLAYSQSLMNQILEHTNSYAQKIRKDIELSRKKF